MITYNNDGTYNLSAMTKEERANYHEAYEYAMVKRDMTYDSPREMVEQYITEKDIKEGYSEYWGDIEANNQLTERG